MERHSIRYCAHCFGILLSVLGSGCSPRKLADQAIRVPAAIAKRQMLSVKGETNAPEATGPVCTVYSLSGTKLGNYGPARVGRSVDFSFELPAGTYDLVFQEGFALRKVVRVEYRAGGPRYDFEISYGDVDENGTVDEKDIAMIRKWQGISFKDLKKWEAFHGTAEQIMNRVPPSRADFNNNQVIDRDDLRLALESVGKVSDPMPLGAKSHP